MFAVGAVKSVILYLIICTLASETYAKIDIEKCLDKESIACLQTYAYRQIREIVDQKSVPLVGGLELVRGGAGVDVAPSELLQSEEGDVAARQEVLERFVAESARHLATERSLRWSEPLARGAGAGGLGRLLPASLEGSPAAEGRAKKLLKAILPVLLGMKLKVVGLVVLAYLGIALLAKQAILASVVSLAVSAITIIRSIVHARHHQPHHFSEHHLTSAPVPVLPSFGHVGFDVGDSSSAHQAAAFAHASLPYSAYKLASH